MADIGYCYGSEWQLLRFLGHHRGYLCRIIQEGTSFKDDIVWADYPLDEKRKSQDGEWKGAYIPTLMARGDWGEIERKWKEFWPCTNSQQGQPSWDGVFTCGEEIVIVEAKAHTEELKSNGTGAGEESKTKIQKALAATQAYFGADTSKNWAKNEYYQIANRLAFVYFLNEKCGVKARLLNLYFLNGWDTADTETDRQKSVKSKDDWQAAIDAEYSALGIDNDKVKEYAQSVFIDCNSL